MQQVLIHNNLLNNLDLASFKSEVEVEVDKLEKVLTGLNSLESQADKLDVNKLVPVSVDLMSCMENDVLKKDIYNAQIKDIRYKIPDITKLAATNTMVK